MFREQGRNHLVMTITYEVFDQSGRILRRKTIPAHSYLKAMAEILCVQMTQANQSIVDTGNVTRTIQAYNTNLNVMGLVSEQTPGIVVGTSSQAVALADYGLVAAIAQGTGSGQLSYSAMSYTSLVTSGTTRKFTLIRSFTNNSGASITIQEVGIYAKAYIAASGEGIICIERSLSSPGALANGNAIAYTYTIGITV